MRSVGGYARFQAEGLVIFPIKAEGGKLSLLQFSMHIGR